MGHIIYLIYVGKINILYNYFYVLLLKYIIFLFVLYYIT